MQASCSIPMFANIVEVDNYKLVDGGVSDLIPIEYTISQGYNDAKDLYGKILDFINKPKN